MAGELRNIVEGVERLQTVTDLAQVLGVLSERLRVVSGDAQKTALSDQQIEAVLGELRLKGLWGEKSDKTLANMVAHGTGKQTAFATLTDGNAAVRAVVETVLAGGGDAPPVTLPPEPEPESKPRRRPGRPRKNKQ